MIAMWWMFVLFVILILVVPAIPFFLIAWYFEPPMTKLFLKQFRVSVVKRGAHEVRLKSGLWRWW